MDISGNGETIVIKEESNEQGSSEEHVYIVENNISEQVKAVEVIFITLVYVYFICNGYMCVYVLAVQRLLHYHNIDCMYCFST